MVKKWIFVFVSLYVSTLLNAQHFPDWQNYDLVTDGVFGISSKKAVNELLPDKRSSEVIVAVIDSGIDTLHEDLSSVLWVNKDFEHGRNYLATELGKEDITYIAYNRKEFFDSISLSRIPESLSADYQSHVNMLAALKHKRENMRKLLYELNSSNCTLDNILRKMGKKNPSLDDFLLYTGATVEEESIIRIVKDRFRFYKNFKLLRECELDKLIESAKYHLEHGLNEKVVEDLKKNQSITYNADVSPDPLGLLTQPNYTAWHGTHVAGIIGAVNNNGIGVNGVSTNVRIMMLKVVGNIRELRERDLANAIRYAVDNGARIINMSFGKPYTWQKVAVDDAVKYAMRKNVLVVIAAGNEGLDLDKIPMFPSRIYKNGSVAEAWIEVGASGMKDNSDLVPSFSNYGKKNVDVFAPGVQIYSTIPGSKYEYSSGTSMAAPVVSGLAALIWGYYPKLTAVQVKEIIMKSVVKRDVLKDKCVSGGVVNAYNALKLAATYK